MTDERWQGILRVIEAAFGDYLTGLVVLRKRVVADVKHKVSDSELLAPLIWSSRDPESDPPRRRSVRVREAAATVEADEAD